MWPPWRCASSSWTLVELCRSESVTSSTTNAPATRTDRTTLAAMALRDEGARVEPGAEPSHGSHSQREELLGERGQIVGIERLADERRRAGGQRRRLIGLRRERRDDDYRGARELRRACRRCSITASPPCPGIITSSSTRFGSDPLDQLDRLGSVCGLRERVARARARSASARGGSARRRRSGSSGGSILRPRAGRSGTRVPASPPRNVTVSVPRTLS